MKKHYSTENNQYTLIRNMTFFTIILNMFLAFLKLFAGIFAHSTAMLADSLHSFSDVITSAGVIIGVYISKKPRDDCHAFGHGKAESISGFLLSLLLLVVGINIGYKGLLALLQSHYQQPGTLAIWAALLSIFIKELQYRITIRVGKALNSTPVIADAWHHRSDAFSSIGALLGIIGARFGFLFLDPLVAILISVIIIKISTNLLKTSLEELMDSSLPSENVKEISHVILDTPYVLSIQDIQSRKYSNTIFLNIAISVDPNHSVFHSHKIAHQVEYNIQNHIKQTTQVHIHVEPQHQKERL